MSGGSLNYFCNALENHIGDFEDIELDDLVKDLANLFHDREWYLSADINEGDWLESRDAFKRKWFTAEGRKERIESYIEKFKDKLLESLGLLSDERCINCRKWTAEDEKGMTRDEIVMYLTEIADSPEICTVCPYDQGGVNDCIGYKKYGKCVLVAAADYIMKKHETRSCLNELYMDSKA